MKFRRFSAPFLSVVICISMLFSISGCGDSKAKGYEKNSLLDTSKPVSLTIASSAETWPQMDMVISKFEEIYPNCTVTCEYIEEYTIKLPLRLQQSTQKIDIFRTVNIQEATEYKDSALNLISEESKKYLDLSKTNAGLVDNFKYTAAENTQYAIPYGGEMRGMYVNTTLLSKYNLEVPKNRSELIHCCEVLYDAGYIPFQSSSSTFAQQLLYPYICNSIVNSDNHEKIYSDIEQAVPGVSEYLRDAYEFLYDIVNKGYFDYKKVEEELGYKFESAEGKAKDFLNVIKNDAGEFVKQDDIGKIAFLPDTQAFELLLSKAKSDYHSEIEYKFILSPVGESGGYAYLSPSDGLAVNNQSDNTDWALEFLNFFFTPEIATEFAKQGGNIANTSDALLEYNVPEERTCDVGQVTFSYPFYKTVTTLMLNGYSDDMIGISKMNAKKYMKDNGDGTYSPAHTSEEYIARLEEEFRKIREAK